MGVVITLALEGCEGYMRKYRDLATAKHHTIIQQLLPECLLTEAKGKCRARISELSLWFQLLDFHYFPRGLRAAAREWETPGWGDQTRLASLLWE